MKKLLMLVFAMSSVLVTAWGQSDDVFYTEASRLTLTGKLFYDTPNPYHRVDTVKYKGFTEEENLQVRMSSGIACLFRTDSEFIEIKADYGYFGERNNTNGISTKGYDLYIRKNGEWVWAASGVSDKMKKGKSYRLLDYMDGSVHECLLYLPLYSEMNSVKIGVQRGSVMEPLENPSRHRIAVFGSSLTHGAGTSRAGMTWPAIFSRNTGIQMLSLGCSGNCKMQTYFTKVLCEADDVDALVFDCFANPNEKLIKERLFPFIEELQKAHPGKPLIFQIPVRRPSTNFNTRSKRVHTSKNGTAAELMKVACRRYQDVYVIYPEVDSNEYEATVDGTHCDNYGYISWEKSIRDELLKIFAEYDIR